MYKATRFLTTSLLAAYLVAFSVHEAHAQDKIRVTKEICYGNAKEGTLHQLDMYLPSGNNFPVVVFAHGGAWMTGDKSSYDYLGKYFAERGIGAIVVNYRLSPKIKHPAHVQDVAKAVAWVHANIGKHGADRDRLFLAGYSAGGHLVSLLGTDESYLRAEGLGFKSIRGVISISGAYSAENLPALSLIFPTEDQDLCFPMGHVKSGAPSFMLFRAEKELFGLDKQATHFHAELKNAGCTVELHDIKGTDHFGISTETVVHTQFGARMVDFINGSPRLAKAVALSR